MRLSCRAVYFCCLVFRQVSCVVDGPRYYCVVRGRCIIDECVVSYTLMERCVYYHVSHAHDFISGRMVEPRVNHSTLKPCEPCENHAIGTITIRIVELCMTRHFGQVAHHAGIQPRAHILIIDRIPASSGGTLIQKSRPFTQIQSAKEFLAACQCGKVSASPLFS